MPAEIANDEAEVDVAAGERRVGGDEARVPAHELHEPDAIPRSAGLGVRRQDPLRQLLLLLKLLATPPALLAE